MGKDGKASVVGFWQILLVLMMCVFGWFSYKWLVFDVQTARALQSSLPVWFYAVPVALWVIGWAVVGLGTVVIPSGRGYMRFRSVLLLWIVSCLAGIVVVVLGMITEPDMYRVGGILIAVGLTLQALILVTLIFEYPSGTEVLFSHIQSILLFMAAFSISAGTQQGFVYRFPGLVPGLASFLFLVTGIIEIFSSRPGLTRVSCLWKKKPRSTQPATGTWWKFHGAVMTLCALLFFMVLLNNTFAIAPDTVEDSHSVMLDIPARDAWTWIVEPSHFLMWNTDFTEYIIPEITQEYEGSIYYLIGERNGKRFILQCTITKWDEPREYSFVGRGDAYDVRGTYEIKFSESGSVVTCTEMYTFRNLRETLAAVLLERKPAFQSVEERLTILREVAGKR